MVTTAVTELKYMERGLTRHKPDDAPASSDEFTRTKLLLEDKFETEVAKNQGKKPRDDSSSLVFIYSTQEIQMCY